MESSFVLQASNISVKIGQMNEQEIIFNTEFPLRQQLFGFPVLVGLGYFATVISNPDCTKLQIIFFQLNYITIANKSDRYLIAKNFVCVNLFYK